MDWVTFQFTELESIGYPYKHRPLKKAIGKKDVGAGRASKLNTVY